MSRYRTWISPNGVAHAVPATGPCSTCGQAHPSLTELASSAKAVEMAHKLADAVGLGNWEDAYAAADWLRDEAALLRAAARDHGGADWLRAERGQPEVAPQPRKGTDEG